MVLAELSNCKDIPEGPYRYIFAYSYRTAAFMFNNFWSY